MAGDSANAPERAAITVERVSFRPDRIVIDVRVADERFAQTSPQLIDEVLKEYPNVLRHSCVNGVGPTFEAVARNTSLPHLLEHLVIDEQTRLAAEADPAANVIFTGKTQWTDRAALQARVEVSYRDDKTALRALQHALKFIGDSPL